MEDVIKLTSCFSSPKTGGYTRLYGVTLGPLEDLHRGLCLKAATLLRFLICCTLVRVTLDFIRAPTDKTASLRQKRKT